MDFSKLPAILTPDLGLLFWMLLAFAVVFFVLAKYGFPAIVGMVEERNRYIEDSLKTPEERAAYIEAAMEENDPEFLTVALGDVARAEGMSKVARRAKLGRENLYRAFAPGGNPTLSTIMRVLKALGLSLRITPSTNIAPGGLAYA